MTDLDLSTAANNSSAYLLSNTADQETSDSNNRYKSIAMSDADYALTADDQQRAGYLEFTGTLTAARNIDMLATKSRQMTIRNSTAGGFDLTVRYAAGGGTVTVSSNDVKTIQATGTDIIEAGGGGGGGGGGPVQVQAVSSSSDWVVLDQQTASAVSTLDLTFDPSLVQELRVDIFGLSVSSSGSDVFLRISENGGSTFISTTNYDNSLHGMRAVDTQLASTDENQSSWRVANAMPAGANQSADIQVWLPDPGSSLIKNFYSRVVTTDSGAQHSFRDNGGRYDGTPAAYNAIRFFPGTGTFSGFFILRGRPKNPISGYASVQTTDATVTTLWSLPLAAGESAMVEAQVTAGISTGTQTYSARILNTGQNAAGTTTVGTQVRDEIELGAPNASLNASLAANDTTDEIELQVTGAAAETWDWVATMTITKI